MTDIIPDVNCHIIRNAGHWIQFEEPEEFNKIIKQIFLVHLL
jgi:pimeloyl-ACP methyl ester carboxylesterase